MSHSWDVKSALVPFIQESLQQHQPQDFLLPLNLFLHICLWSSVSISVGLLLLQYTQHPLHIARKKWVSPLFAFKGHMPVLAEDFMVSMWDMCGGRTISLVSGSSKKERVRERVYKLSEYQWVPWERGPTLGSCPQWPKELPLEPSSQMFCLPQYHPWNLI